MKNIYSCIQFRVMWCCKLPSYVFCLIYEHGFPQWEYLATIKSTTIKMDISIIHIKDVSGCQVYYRKILQGF